MTKLRVVLCLLAVVAFGPALAGAADGDQEKATDKASVGQKAPDFKLKDCAGRETSLSEFSGKIVVLEWINQKCPVSRGKHKDSSMQDTCSSFEGKDVVWLAIDSSHYADAEANGKYIEKLKLPYVILHDADGKVGKQYGAKTTPHMFVIDAEGVLAYAGALDDAPPGKEVSDPRNYVVDAVNALLKGSQVAVSTIEPYGCSVKYAK